MGKPAGQIIREVFMRDRDVYSGKSKLMTKSRYYSVYGWKKNLERNYR